MLKSETLAVRRKPLLKKSQRFLATAESLKQLSIFQKRARTSITTPITVLNNLERWLEFARRGTAFCTWLPLAGLWWRRVNMVRRRRCARRSVYWDG